MKRFLYPFLLPLLLTTSGYAQLTSCTQTLRLARSTYDQGRLHEIPALLESCLKNGFSQSEKVEAYKLLCLSYIYLEEPEKADEAMLSLLRTDNYFEIKPSSDPAEFVALYKTFRTDPVYRLGGKIGANATQPNVVSYVPANDGTSKYSTGIGFQAGLALEVPLKKGLTFTPELNLSLKNFKYSNEATYTDLATGNGRNFSTTASENQTWLSLPILVQYQVMQNKFKDKKLKPFLGAGVSTDFLISSKNKFLRTKQDASSLEEQNLTITDQRNRINLSAVVVGGTKIKVTGGFVVAEVRYTYGLTKVNDKENIYSLFEKTFPTNGYVDGIFKLNNLNVSVGYVYNIFNPKKLTR